ncbi:hypothetical protein HYZ97_05120 [Candidatus Pacearchaeota archaeon]|nr:hypothetical protein [Candidatus Pacearchaeota archaeon]
MARFAVNQPWHFGYTPRDYYDTLTRKQKANVHLPHLSLDTLEELFEMTLKTPPARAIHAPKIIDMMALTRHSAPLTVLSVACYCKPLGELDIDSSFLRMLASKLEECTIPFCTKKSSNAVYAKTLTAWISEEVRREYERIEKRYQQGKLARQERDLMSGILFGFPLGEVFS